MTSKPCTTQGSCGSLAGRRQLLRGATALLCGAAWPTCFAEAGHVVRSWPAGRPPPPLDLADLDGKLWKLDALAGQVVVLNFWATWCEPCRMEMPSLEALALQRRGQGVVVVAVNYREKPAAIRTYLERAPFGPPILLDSEGDATTAWTPRVFPSTVVIGRDGRPVHTVVGALDWGSSEGRALLDPIVAVSRR